MGEGRGRDDAHLQVHALTKAHAEPVPQALPPLVAMRSALFLLARRKGLLLALFLLTIAALIRVGLALRPGLWVDEIFSLAVATGHSLEHPAAEADPRLGDYIEGPQAQPPSVWRRYMEAEVPPAGPSRIIRAVRLSDTSPPLYYLLLAGWIRLTGTSDGALRLLSTLAAVLCLPLIWRLGVAVADRRSALSACMVFAFAPAAVYYSAEGRMYSLTWPLGLVLAAVSLHLAREGARTGSILTWIAAGAAGLLTHYYFAFVWLACVTWLCLHPGRMKRSATIMAATTCLILVLPWYLQIPASLSRWRVTAGWLDGSLNMQQVLTGIIWLPWRLFGTQGSWGGFRSMELLTTAMLVGLTVVLLLRGIKPFFSPRLQIFWLWLAASVLGVIAFDLVQGTHASLHWRYVLPGLPAAVLLLGFAIAALPGNAATAFLVALCLAWSTSIYHGFSRPRKPSEPFPLIAADLEAHLDTTDLIIVNSNPSGVLGVARYMKQEIPIASWVAPLGVRQFPEDLIRLVDGRCRVGLVTVHAEPGAWPPEVWMRKHAVPDGETRFAFSRARILYYELGTAKPGCKSAIPDAAARGPAQLMATRHASERRIRARY